MKLVINRCYGGFGLSILGKKEFLRCKGLDCFPYKQTKYSFQDGIDEYTYTPNCENKDMFVHISTKFLGDTIDNCSGESWYWKTPERNDADLIGIIETFGSEKISGACSNLEIVEIPDDINWEIEEYDGTEWVSEKHRTW